VIKHFPSSSAALSDCTAVVTGTSAGIGEEAAFHLAKLGAHVICAVRNTDKGEAAIAKMKTRAGEGTTLNMKVMKMDISDLTSVHEFLRNFERIIPSIPPLKLLLNNAGIAGYPSSGVVSNQNHDLIFDTNHLGHFVLTNGLLPHLRQSAPSRIVIVSSGSHLHTSVTASDLRDVETLKTKIVSPKPSQPGFSDTMKTYGDSKLMNVLHAQELQRREHANGVTAVSLHPGNMITTSIADTQGAFNKFMFKNVLSWFTKSVNQGTSTTLYCVLADAESVAGKYHSSCGPAKTNKLATPEAAATVWAMSETLAKL
jgi:WW domain-containing oxidoreductase